MERKRIYLTAATYRDKFMIRFVVCSRHCQPEDIDFAWDEITSQVDEILRSKRHQHQLIDYNNTNKEIELPGKQLVAIAATIEGLKMNDAKASPKIS